MSDEPTNEYLREYFYAQSNLYSNELAENMMLIADRLEASEAARVEAANSLEIYTQIVNRHMAERDAAIQRAETAESRVAKLQEAFEKIKRYEYDPAAKHYTHQSPSYREAYEALDKMAAIIDG